MGLLLILLLLSWLEQAIWWFGVQAVVVLVDYSPGRLLYWLRWILYQVDCIIIILCPTRRGSHILFPLRFTSHTKQGEFRRRRDVEAAIVGMRLGGGAVYVCLIEKYNLFDLIMNKTLAVCVHYDCSINFLTYDAFYCVIDRFAIWVLTRDTKY